jgi:hypothetical protein
MLALLVVVVAATGPVFNHSAPGSSSIGAGDPLSAAYTGHEAGGIVNEWPQCSSPPCSFRVERSQNRDS